MKKYIAQHKQDIIFYSVLIILLLVFHLVFFNGFIPSESMENTLMTKDRIIGLKVVKEYHRGDVAVFHYDDKDLYIKRVIGVGGDKVLIKDNKVYVNGKELNEPYLKEPMIAEDAQYYVPKDSYFFLGDNRNESKDSRYWDNPFRTKEDMVAKAVFRYWPITQWKIIE